MVNNDNMIKSVFTEIMNEALNKQIILKEYEEGIGELDFPVRVGYTFNDDREGYIPFHIYDVDYFFKLLKEYTYQALVFYELEPNRNNIKKVLTYIWSNVSSFEIDDLESFLENRIEFFNGDQLNSNTVSKSTDIGSIKGYVDKQSFLQETPYCFKSEFASDDKVYRLPRISFGIKDNECIIYAIQNKDTLPENKQDTEYNELVQRTLRGINSGVKKYRNVTPSFVVALTYFISFLKENGITTIRTIPSLPVRLQNRELVNSYKVDRQRHKLEVLNGSGTITSDTLDTFKKELEDKRLQDKYNVTTKFTNCFERLKVHFSGIYISNIELTDELLLEVSSLAVDNRLLQQIVAENQINMVK